MKIMQRTTSSIQRLLRIKAVALFALGLAAANLNAATHIWLGGTNFVDWGNNANWSSGAYPNAADEVVLVTNVSNIQFSNGIEQVTFGSLIFSNVAPATSGSLVVGNNTQAGVVLTAQTTTGKPQFFVGTNGNHTVFFYASNLAGTQGFDKTGPGKFTFRFSGFSHPYTGDISILGGILGINQNSSLGNDNNDIAIANGARLTAEPGSNSGAVTLPSTRTLTLNGTQSQLSASAAAVELVVEGAVGGAGGLTKVDAGKLSLNGTATYAGPTRVVGGTVDFNITSGTFTNGDEILVNANTAVLDFQDLGFLTMNNVSPKQFRVIPTGSSVISGEVADCYLANGTGTFAGGTNNITASSVLVGSATQSAGDNHQARLHLGMDNTFNTASLQLGGFNAKGVVDFQSSPSAPSLKLRNTNATDRVPLVKIGETSSGTRSGAGNLNLSGGSLDAQVDTLILSRHVASATNPDNSQATVDNGTLDVLTMVLCEKTNNGAGGAWPTLTATLNMNNGTLKARTIMMGREFSGTNYPVLVPTINLVNGTHNLGAVTNGPGGYNTVPTTSRNINWNEGTLRNYDGTTDMVIDGGAGAGDRVRININVLGGSTTPTLFAEAGRSITLGVGSGLMGSSFPDITNAGPGTLVINSVTNSWTGKLWVGNGTLSGSGILNGEVEIGSAAKLAPGTSLGTLTINSNLTLAGSAVFELNRTNSPANSDRVAGLSSVTYGGTLVVTNVGEDLQVGDSFKLFDGAAYGGSFSSITYPVGYGFTNKLAIDGTIEVTSVPASEPPTLNYEVDGANWVFTWTGSGFKLQSQTNVLSVGLTATNWSDVPGGSTSGVSVPGPDKNQPAVFFRLISTP